MPPDHQKYLQWNDERFTQWAEKIGENTAAVVRLFLTSRQVEQQGYKSCMVLLKLADQDSPICLEAACKQALSFSLAPSLKSVQSILKSGQDKLLSKETVQPKNEARDILELVAARSKTASTIFCSQYDTAEWHENLYDSNLANAICDRIIYDAYTIQIEGESMRKRKGIVE